MSTTPIFIHTTNTTRVPGPHGDDWEFSCQVCGYQARYIQATASGTHRLEILSIGDPRARHTSSLDGADRFDEDTVAYADEFFGEDQGFEGYEVWLPPNLCAQVEEILSRLNFDG